MRTDLAIASLEQGLTQRPRLDIALKVYSHATTGEAFTVKHTLGVIPRSAYALPYTKCAVWSEEADRNMWDKTRVLLRCDVALAPMDVTIIE